MTRINAADLPANVRKKLGIDVTANGRAKRPRPGKGTTVCRIWCHTCGTLCTSEASIEKHGQETGHARYELVARGID